MAIAESILFQINSTNYTAPIFTVYQPQAGYSGFVTTLRLTVNINSIEEASFPYIPDDTPPDVLQAILDEVAVNTPFKEIVLYVKKGNGAWIERAPIRIFNKEPYYDVNLMRFFSDSNTIDVAEDLSLGIQIKTGNVLTSADAVLVWGSVVAEKKNNGNEELAARIEVLELALAGKLTELPANTLLGRDTITGNVQQIPQSRFAPANSPIINGEARIKNTSYPKLILEATGNGADLKKFQMFVRPDGAFFFAPLSDAENASPGGYTITSAGDVNFASTTQSTSPSNGGMTAFSLGVASNLNVGGTLRSGGFKVFPWENTHTFTTPNSLASGVFSGDTNIDTAVKGWHFFTSLRSAGDYGVQLALCDTQTGLKYRSKIAGTWQAWNTIL